MAHSSSTRFSGITALVGGEIILGIIILKILWVGSEVPKLRAPKLKINPQKRKISPLSAQCLEGGVGLALAECGMCRIWDGHPKAHQADACSSSFPKRILFLFCFPTPGKSCSVGWHQPNSGWETASPRKRLRKMGMSTSQVPAVARRLHQGVYTSKS